MAAIFARNSAHIFVGKKGGLTYPSYKTGKYEKKVLKDMNLLEVHIAQNH